VIVLGRNMRAPSIDGRVNVGARDAAACSARNS